jgi:hypothetical protein
MAVLASILCPLASSPSPIRHGSENHPGGVALPRTMNAILRPMVHVVSQPLAGTTAIYSLGSIGTKALSAVSLPNLSLELVLSDAKTNTSKVLGLVPGGSAVSPNSITGAGGAFFVALLNTTTLVESYEKVTTAGKVSSVAPPLVSTVPWSFPYGNATALVAGAQGRLLVLNPATLAVSANYSSALPSRLLIDVVLPSGTSLYLAGTLFGKLSSNTSAWFGVLDTTTKSLTRISAVHYLKAPVGAAFYALASAGGYVYVGGGVQSFNTSPFDIQTVFGLFYRYSPASGAFTNRSSLLPTQNETVWALAPWKATVLLSVEGFQFTANSSWESGGIFTVGVPGGKLISQSSLLPSGFLADFFLVTSESGGYIFLGGFNTSSGLGQLIAIRP